MDIARSGYPLLWLPFGFFYIQNSRPRYDKRSPFPAQILEKWPMMQKWNWIQRIKLYLYIININITRILYAYINVIGFYTERARTRPTPSQALNDMWGHFSEALNPPIIHSFLVGTNIQTSFGFFEKTGNKIAFAEFL